MKNNYTKKLFEINKCFIISFLIIVSFCFVENTHAISGACSSHNGVNCSAGRQLNGKAYCNDGWAESIADYDFMIMCRNYEYSCTSEEWKKLSQKYNLEDLFFQTQNLVDEMGDIANSVKDVSKSVDYSSFYTLQALLDIKNNQYNLATSFAEAECKTLGADRVVQQNYENIESDFYSAQIQIEQDKIAQLEQEKQKLTENYLNALKNLNTCPANSTLNGTICPCNDGYVSNGSACITYTQSCQTKYGTNSYGDRQYCHCATGYEWNTSQTACIKIEVKPIILPPTAKSVAPETIISKEEVQKITKPTKKLVVKNEPPKEDLSAISKPEKTSMPKEEIKNEAKPEFFIRIFGSIKNFFLNFFK